MAYTTINKSSDHFNTVLYTGNGSTQSITGVGFQPDWVWIKERNTAVNHQVFDVIRGATIRLYPDDTSAENTNANSLTAFDSDGFSLGNAGSTNGSSDTYVSWNWLGANGTASNTDGSITSTVSANTTSGFSIVSYTGTGANATVGHGLGAAPKMVIIKSRDSAFSWRSYHASIGATKYIVLNSGAASVTASNFMNDTEPTSSVFSLGNGQTPNESGDDYIAYCFAEKKGFSRFRKYTGTGNADGPFVYTGFKPAFVMIKAYDTASRNWSIKDNKRDVDNPALKQLLANGDDAESDDAGLDILSNGFKCRGTSSNINQNGVSYLYIAFAEAPIVGTNNVPANAR